MTRNRRSKRAIRPRMEQTGEKYTEARRVLAGTGGGAGGTGEEPGVTFDWPEDSLGWFTDQAYNVILLADDEARMLSHATVEPEHLLLAATRTGNVERLLPGMASPIQDVILRIRGFGARLELQPRRSPASEQVLRHAVLAAAERGVLGPSSEHLLLALGDQEVLAELGVTDVEALVEATYPTGPPVDPAFIARRAAQLRAHGRSAPSPGPIPPIFERFTSQARAAIEAGVRYAREADEGYVEPVHLLLGVLTAPNGVVASLRERHGWQLPVPASTRPPYLHATDIFTPASRRIVAEDVLVVAERTGHRALTTGHLLIAMLERPDERTRQIVSALPGAGEVKAVVIDALPGDEETGAT